MPTIAPVERPLLPFFGDEVGDAVLSLDDEVDEAVGAEVDDNEDEDEEEGAMDVSVNQLVIITPVKACKCPRSELTRRNLVVTVIDLRARRIAILV